MEVECGLVIQQFFGHRAAYEKNQKLFREQPGELLFKKIKVAIDDAINQKMDLRAPTKNSEVKAQLEAGTELLDLGDFPMPFEYKLAIPRIYNFDMDGPEADKQRRNTEEAIKAFQTLLLLKPESHQAKMSLAACFLKPTIARVDEARNYYREIIEDGVNDNWFEPAKKALTLSFAQTNPNESLKWYLAAVEHGTNSAAAEFFRQQAESTRLALVPRLEGEKAIEQAEVSLIEGFTNAWSQKKSFNFVTYDFVKQFGTNQAAAAQRLGELYPKLKLQAPELAPYLLAQILPVQVDTNAPVVVEFQLLLEQLGRHPDQLFKPGEYWANIWSAYQWSFKHRLYHMAAELLEGKIGTGTYAKDDKIGLGYAYFGDKQWEKALRIFETFSNQPVRMGNNGPWGYMFRIVFPGKWADRCREKFGLQLTPNPFEFKMGKPLLCLCSPSTFTADADGLWLGINGQLLYLNFELKTNFVTNLPLDASVTITTICQTPSSVWIGTDGAGLIEFDKATQQIRLLTQKDGLFMNSISSLCLSDNELWIGYGAGLGRLDLLTKQLTSFTLSLTNDLNILKDSIGNTARESGNQPTRRQVIALAGGISGDVWFLTDNSSRH